MSVLRSRRVAAALCLSASLIGSSAVAATVGHGNRVNFLAAVGGQPIVEDSFDYSIEGDPQIVFESGVVSTGDPAIDHPSRNAVWDFRGVYLNALSNLDPEMSQTLTWVFPEMILGFGMDFHTALVEPPLALTFLGQTLIPMDIPGLDDSSFIGYLSDQPFQSVTFSTFSPLGPLVFAVDDLVFVPYSPAAVPLPGTIALFISSLGGLAIVRRRRRNLC